MISLLLQAGLDAAGERAVDSTALNPILKTSSGLLLVMYTVPSLPTMPPSPQVLRHLWPRLQHYIILGPSDPIWNVCEDGAKGDEVSHEEVPRPMFICCFDDVRNII